MWKNKHGERKFTLKTKERIFFLYFNVAEPELAKFDEISYISWVYLNNVTRVISGTSSYPQAFNSLVKLYSIEK